MTKKTNYTPRDIVSFIEGAANGTIEPGQCSTLFVNFGSDRESALYFSSSAGIHGYNRVAIEHNGEETQGNKYLSITFSACFETGYKDFTVEVFQKRGAADWCVLVTVPA